MVTREPARDWPAIWLAGLNARVLEALHGGNPSAIAAAQAAREELLADLRRLNERDQTATLRQRED